MRIVKTAVAVMISYSIFQLLGLVYQEELPGVWGMLGPSYACIACIVCTQSSLGQTVRQGVSRFIGVAVGGTLSVITLLLGDALESPWVTAPVLGAVCLAGLWFCLLIRRPAACGMACIVPCVILIRGVAGADRYYYAAARIIETVLGVGVAFLVNAALPDRRPEAEPPPTAAPAVRVDNSAQKLCVIGDPVEHSKSPLIQNAMIDALGLNYIYLCQRVPRGQCAQWLECAKFAGYAGFNATMPHKEELVPLMDHLDGDAALFGAVNTVCIRDGAAWGYNTDGAGFLRALAAEGIDPTGKTVLLLGAGGAAKAVALKLAQHGAERVFVCNRTLERARALCAADPTGRLRPAGFDGETLRSLAEQAALLVNCTSLGMEGTAGQFEDFSFLDALPADAPVVDLIYAPAETQLLARARAGGRRTINGLGLLVHQAALSLELFTGETVNKTALEACFAALENR